MVAFDFHIHGKRTSKATFNIHDFLNIISNAKKQNLNCIAITEHAHAKHFNEAYDYLKKNYIYNNEYYLIDGIKVFTGVEVTVAEGFDVVCINHRDEVMKIQKHCPNGRGELTFSDLFKLITKEALVTLAHPYRKHEYVNIPENILERIDAVEINANELNKRDNKIYDSREEQLLYLEHCFSAHKAKIEHLSYTLNKPAITGSDSHIYTRVGCIKTILNEDADSLEQIKKQIKLRNFEVEFTNSLLANMR